MLRMKLPTNSFSTKVDRFIGVDPGLRGAFAVIDGVEHPTFVELHDCPLGLTGKPDRDRIIEIVRAAVAGHDVVAYVEKIQTFGKDRRRRAGLEKLAANSQQWFMALRALGVNTQEVLPQQWMRDFIPPILFGEAMRSQRFAEFRRQAVELYPQSEIKLVKDTDRAVAVLLAEYGRRQYRTISRMKIR